MSNQDYTALWNSFIGGNDDAFYQLYKLCYPELLGFGSRQYSDKERVKDVINQTFVYFWEKRANLRLLEMARPYIYTSFIRKLSASFDNKGQTVVPIEYLPSEVQDAQPSPESLLIYRHHNEALRDRISKAIAKLSARKRELVMLKYYEGLSYKEICRRTGLSERTAYNKLHEAVKALKEDLESMGAHEKDAVQLFFAM